MKTIKVILVDDHQIVRDGIKSLLSHYNDIEIIDEAENGYQLLEKLKVCSPDVVMLDINMPKLSGIEVTKIVHKEYPEIKILMLSMYTNESFVLNAIKAGVDGYLEKNTTKKELYKAIIEIKNGNEYFSPSITENIFKSIIDKTKVGVKSPTESEKNLTDREKEILFQVLEGLNNHDIAEKLCISTRTVEAHKSNIFKKLRINNMVELVKYAIQHNLISI